MRHYTRYRQSVRVLESLVRLEQERRFSKLDNTLAYGKLGLKRCQRLLDYLGNPEKNLALIHVGGTSGKGSVVNLIHSILDAAGVRVGSYMSPHVTSPLERIIIGPGLASPRAFADGVSELLGFIEDEYREGPYGIPSYHELMFALALKMFQDSEREFAVLEVGIGGTLDSTNVIPVPKVAVITSVGFDHTDLLGKTLGKIARDKAGIIKPGTTVISGVQREEARLEIEKQARATGVPLWQLGAELTLHIQGETFEVRWPGGSLDGLESRGRGQQQLENAALGIGAIVQLKGQGTEIPPSALSTGMNRAFLPGRFEVVEIPGMGVLVLDIAHNVDKVACLVSSWVSRFGRGGAALVAISASKDTDGVLSTLAKGFDTLIVTRPLAVSRPMVPPLTLQKRAESLGITSTLKLDPWEALREGFKRGSGRVAVTGSTYLVGELRKLFVREEVIAETGVVLPLSQADIAGFIRDRAEGPHDERP